MTDQLPNDPFMLMSAINMKLRDEFPTLDELCATLNIVRKDLELKLQTAGFEYSPENNKFW
ncbi:MAG: DUF4250 domain-containing protein [Bacteroidaceae bacterium]|mgnify:CR=1|nr:DUF4250 domain-containing protein [Bacteroidaceae bacterium]